MNALRIFLVDDSPDIRKLMKGFLEDLGCDVVMEAAKRCEGVEKAKLVKDFGVDVAIIDAKLDSGECDGRFIHETVKNTDPTVVTISFSMFLQNWGDYRFQKGDSMDGLRDLLAKIAKEKGVPF